MVVTLINSNDQLDPLATIPLADPTAPLQLWRLSNRMSILQLTTFAQRLWQPSTRAMKVHDQEFQYMEKRLDDHDNRFYAPRHENGELWTAVNVLRQRLDSATDGAPYIVICLDFPRIPKHVIPV